MVLALDRPAKYSFLFVDIFSEVTGNVVAQYTNKDFSVGSYRSIPLMEVELAPNSAIADSGGELETKVSIPVLADDAFMLRLTDGLPHQPLIVRIREIVEGVQPGDQGSILTWVWGSLIYYKRNTPRRGWVEIICRPDKSEYNSPSGMVCAGQCRNTLFSPPCGRQGSYGPARNDEQRNATVASVNFQQLTVLSYTAIASPKTFRRGYVIFDNARITISDWDVATPNLFLMLQSVPPSWDGEEVLLVPGCNLSLEACRLQWNNEGRFNGAGYKCPSDNPVFDVQR